jgi:hypothetical protein
MPDFLQAADLINDRLTALNPTGWPIAYENGNFDPVTEGQTGWLYIEIAELSRGLITIGDTGTRLERGYCEAHIWCYGPRGSGDEPRQKANMINDLFDNDPIPGIDITEREIGRGRVDGDSSVSPGRWYGVPVMISFNYDEEAQ